VRDNDPGYRYYKYVSQYKTHLERYYALFEKDQIKIILFDDLKTQPDSVYRDLFQFLGVDATFTIPNADKIVNSYSVPKIRSVQSLLTNLANLPVVRRIPQGIKKPIVKVAHILSSLNTKKSNYPKLPNRLFEELSLNFTGDIEYIEQILGRRLNE